MKVKLNKQLVFALGIATLAGFVSAHTTYGEESRCIADFNSSGAVDQADLQILLDNFNTSNLKTDIYPDGTTNAYDLAILLGDWGSCKGESCPEDLNHDGQVEGEDLQILLALWSYGASVSGSPADFNADTVVNARDLAILLGAWGPCDRDSCTQRATLKDPKFFNRVSDLNFDRLISDRLGQQKK